MGLWFTMENLKNYTCTLKNRILSLMSNETIIGSYFRPYWNSSTHWPTVTRSRNKVFRIYGKKVCFHQFRNENIFFHVVLCFFKKAFEIVDSKGHYHTLYMYICLYNIISFLSILFSYMYVIIFDFMIISRYLSNWLGPYSDHAQLEITQSPNLIANNLSNRL